MLRRRVLSQTKALRAVSALTTSWRRCRQPLLTTFNLQFTALQWFCARIAGCRHFCVGGVDILVCVIREAETSRALWARHRQECLCHQIKLLLPQMPPPARWRHRRKLLSAWRPLNGPSVGSGLTPDTHSEPAMP